MPWTRNKYETAYASKILTKDTRTGLVVPAWRSLVKMGLDAGSPYSRTIQPKVDSSWADFQWRFFEWNTTTQQWSPCEYRIYGDMALYHLIGYLPSSMPVVDYSALEREAVIAFLLKVREEVTPFKALPFLGELKETIRMIRHPLSGIRKYTMRYNRRANAHRRLKKAGDVADALADSYLQWVYGVSPLIGDINDAVTAFQSLCSDDTKQIPISVTVKGSSFRVRSSSVIMYYDYGGRSSFSVVESSKTRLQIKGAIKSDVAHPITGQTLPRLGIVLEEFIPTVWELLPYSFLVDYVTNVGDIIGAKAVALTDIAWAWQSTRTELTETGICIPLPWLYPGRPGISSPYPIPSVANAKYISFNRKKPSLKVSFSRSFEFNLPSLRQSVNSTVLAFSKARSL